VKRLHICAIAVAWSSGGGSITSISRKKAMKFATRAAITLGLVCAPPWTIPASAPDDGIPVSRASYADHPVLPDFTAPACPDNPRGLDTPCAHVQRALTHKQNVFDDFHHKKRPCRSRPRRPVNHTGNLRLSRSASRMIGRLLVDLIRFAHPIMNAAGKT
jgi:hypothetical protein